MTRPGTHETDAAGSRCDASERPGAGRAHRLPPAGRAVGALVIGLVVVLAAGSAGTAVAGQAPPVSGPCGGKDHAILDFWVGEWDVFVKDPERGERKVGTNRIEKILGGCAILEHWTDAHGREGKSFFYRDPVAALWKQVWVTGDGNIKEKSLVERRDEGGVVFRGAIPRIDGGSFLDRTTLTPLAGGGVRQVIEQSSDDGKTWSVTFDAYYVRPGAASTP